jgi:tetratricopeptide (TPR) repeat protein
MKGETEEALDLVSRSLIRNWHNHKARHLKVAILRKLGRLKECTNLIKESLGLDQFNYGVLFEQYLLEVSASREKTPALEELKRLIGDNIHTYMEFSLDYAMAGSFDEAGEILELGITDAANVYPLVYYLKGWYASQKKERQMALSYFEKAEEMKPDYCFPNRLEEILALQCSLDLNPKGARAPYYLGNFQYSVRLHQKAVACWERSKELNKTFPTVRRNLSLAYYNKYQKVQEALEEMEAAFSLDESDSRILMELDQLYKKMNKPFAQRLALLEKYPDALAYRDDLYLEVITLYNQLGDHHKALRLLMDRAFHPWEGGEGKVTGQYLFAHTEIAKKAIASADYQKALEHLDATDAYPHHLGEGKLFGAQENDIFYWKGCAYMGLGDTENATVCWQKASTGLSEPSAAMFYNDQQPDKIFYQGLALLKLNRNEEARSRFNKLKDYGEKHIFDTVKIDYFAVSLPDLLIWDDDLQKRNRLHCEYLMGLGHLGLKNMVKARDFFTSILSTDVNHTGAQVHLELAGATRL